jgi:uncharacterized membrane protein
MPNHSWLPQSALIPDQVVGRGSQVGVLLAAAVVPTTFARSLSERSWIDQGVITGLATGSHFLLTVVTQDMIEAAGSGLSTLLPLPASWSDDARAQAATLLLDAIAIPAGFGLASAVGFRDQESQARAAVRQVGWRLAITGLGATLLSGGLAATRRIDSATGAEGRIARLPIGIPIGVATALIVERWRQRSLPPEHVSDPARSNPLLGLAAGAGVVLVLGGVAAGEVVLARKLGSVGSRVLPGSETTWSRATHLVALGGLIMGTHELWKYAMRGIEAGTGQFDEGMDETAPGVWTTPMVSGDPASLVSWQGMGREGRRHVVTFARPEPLTDRPVEFKGAARPELSIRTVMQEDPKASPICIFVGLDNAPTANERVELALAEMDRTDAWSRSLLMLASPTGTGYVNYVATAAAQYLTLGDIATITLQYSKRPSPLSLGMIGDAQSQNRLLWLRILERLRAMPPDARPRVVLFGESLGAHTSQAAFAGWGTLGPEALGIDRALWIGTPESSRWRQEIIGPDRPDVDKALVAVVNDYEQFCDLAPEARAKVRYVLLSHDNDGVTKFGAGLLSQRPPWLGPNRPAMQEVPGRSPRGIPASMRWRPIITFFQTLIDMKNAQLPGAYRAWAHDYRPDLPEFIRDVYGLTCTGEQMDRIKEACELREQFREAVFE